MLASSLFLPPACELGEARGKANKKVWGDTLTAPICCFFSSLAPNLQSSPSSVHAKQDQKCLEVNEFLLWNVNYFSLPWVWGLSAPHE